jgi:ABC-type methionine transport system ATPase subunit
LFTRKDRQKAKIEHDRQAVKMIMSKFEILQNKKIHHEIAILNSWTDEADRANEKLHKYLFPMYVLSDVVFFLIVT